MAIASPDRLDQIRPDQPGPHCRRSCLDTHPTLSLSHRLKYGSSGSFSQSASSFSVDWIGNQVHCDFICEEAGFELLEDFVRLSEKDIREMTERYEKRTQAQGHIPFGLRHIKLLIGVMHWVQDQDCCYRNASTGDIADSNEFREIIDISIQRAALQKVEYDQVDMISKAADPGKFKDERKWPDWEPAFVNYLSTIPGSYHVPLSYVV